LPLGSLLGLPESEAFSVSFNEVHSVGETVEQCSGETLTAEDFGPVLKGEIGGDHEAMELIGPSEYLEE
jgi:hypothetical protein